MPSANLGKRSMQKLTAQKYEGLSASQQVKAAQWTGQLAWRAADHPSSGSSSSHQHPYYEADIDYDKPWFERRDGEYYCTLCNSYANEGHVYSEKHKNRSENPQWYGFADFVNAPTPADFDKPWFEKRDNQFYCLLCNAFATEGHLGGDKHKKRSEYPDYYGFAGSAGSAESAPQHVDAQYEKPWFESKDGEWYCNLCNSYATLEHIRSDKHTKRSMYPDSYGFPQTPLAITNTEGLWHPQAADPQLPWQPSTAPALAVSASASPWQPDPAIQALALTPHAPGADSSSLRELPEPWTMIFSEEHQRPYYYNRNANITQWESPI